jgi:hypothetical protein
MAIAAKGKPEAASAGCPSFYAGAAFYDRSFHVAPGCRNCAGERGDDIFQVHLAPSSGAGNVVERSTNKLRMCGAGAAPELRRSSKGSNLQVLLTIERTFV